GPNFCKRRKGITGDLSSNIENNCYVASHTNEGTKMSPKLWQPIQVGDIKLDHRLAMAPMTRMRATAQGVPTDLNAEYYAQRASMALVTSEGTQPSDDGQGYLFTPGIYTDDHVTGWRNVTEAVRRAGGQM